MDDAAELGRVWGASRTRDHHQDHGLFDIIRIMDVHHHFRRAESSDLFWRGNSIIIITTGQNLPICLGGEFINAHLGVQGACNSSTQMPFF